MDSCAPPNLEARLRRLERTNRLLLGFCTLTIALALAGWRAQASPDLKVRRLEVVDDRGVPVVTLGTTRMDRGGAITLRAANGERRIWLNAEDEGASLTLNREGKDGENDSTAGISVGPNRGQVSILSKQGASLNASVANDEPKVELLNSKGASLFVAPWRQ